MGGNCGLERVKEGARRDLRPPPSPIPTSRKTSGGKKNRKGRESCRWGRNTPNLPSSGAGARARAGAREGRREGGAVSLP